MDDYIETVLDNLLDAYPEDTNVANAVETIKAYIDKQDETIDIYAYNLQAVMDEICH